MKKTVRTQCCVTETIR